MEGKRIAIIDKDGGKLLDVVESSASPGVFGIVALNPDGSDIVWGGGGGGGTWGSITGTLSNQTDLQNALNAKQNSLGFTPEDVANKDVDGTLAANSDTKYPSQKAVKTYVDAGLWNKVAKAWDTMTGALDLPSANITGTAGAWYLTLVGQSANPAAPAAGTLLLHASTNNGFTRLEQDNEAATNLVYGRDNAFIAKNTSGSTISKGQVVYVTGSTGNVPNVSLAQANASGTIPTIAIAADSIANNAFGQIMYAGILSGIDTSAFSSGDKLFVSPTVAGGLTNVRPSGTTNFVQRVGTVLVSGVGNGSIQILIAPAVLNMETGTNAATWTGRAVVGDSFNGVALSTSAGATNFLAGDGTYKAVSGSSAPDVIATRSLI